VIWAERVRDRGWENLEEGDMGRACDRKGVGKNWRKVIWAERVTERELGKIGGR
jgi:hypothetical protein